MTISIQKALTHSFISQNPVIITVSPAKPNPPYKFAFAHSHSLVDTHNFIKCNKQNHTTDLHNMIHDTLDLCHQSLVYQTTTITPIKNTKHYSSHLIHITSTFITTSFSTSQSSHHTHTHTQHNTIMEIDGRFLNTGLLLVATILVAKLISAFIVHKQSK